MDHARYKLLAQAMLSALSEDINDDDVNFPSLPAAVYSAQHALFTQLHADSFLIGEEASCSFVEPGCTEHNIVHGGIAPHKLGSTGRVNVKPVEHPDGPMHEFYPGVFDMAWELDDEQITSGLMRLDS